MLPVQAKKLRQRDRMQTKNLIIIDVEEVFNRRRCRAQGSFEEISSLWKASPNNHGKLTIIVNFRMH